VEMEGGSPAVNEDAVLDGGMMRGDDHEAPAVAAHERRGDVGVVAQGRAFREAEDGGELSQEAEEDLQILRGGQGRIQQLIRQGGIFRRCFRGIFPGNSRVRICSGAGGAQKNRPEEKPSQEKEEGQQASSENDAAAHGGGRYTGKNPMGGLLLAVS
jgi:hypothetical protein